MKRARLVLILAFAALFAAIAPASALSRANLSPAPLNPDYIRYLEDVRAGRDRGTIPPKAYLSPQADARRTDPARAATPERSFDLVQKGWITPVKAQIGWGTCWDFATMEAIESNLKKETGVEHDLSELHLGFFAYYDESAEKPAFDKHPTNNRNPIFDNGGTARISTAILSRGTGPVDGAAAPYPDADPSDDKFWLNFPEDPEVLRDELLAVPNLFRLKESLTFHTSDDIKRALMEYGGLWVTFCADMPDLSDPYILSSDTTINHAVLLVGWNDDLSRDLFKGPNAGYKSPNIDGGWKIQNSWGLSRDKDGKEVQMGDDGYYWISYADTSIEYGFEQLGVSSFVAMPVDSYRHTYSHDPLGMTFALDVDDTSVTAANVFTSERNEDIVRVGFWTEGHDVDYAIQVYRGVPADGNPDDGTPAFDAPLRGHAAFPGYRTVELATPVPLNKGERFAVVVTLESNDEILLPVEAMVNGSPSKATFELGESYIRTDDDGWVEAWTLSESGTDDDGDPYDIVIANVTIKAFTNDANRSSSSSGCATGAFALVLMVAIPVLLRKR